MEVSLPSNWRRPALDKYNGNTNPDKHINVYITQISLYTTDDTHWSIPHIFEGGQPELVYKTPTPTTLFSSITWPTSLEHNLQRHHLTSIVLVNIRLEKTESLRAFMEHFGKIALVIWNLSLEVPKHHMVMTLKLRSFFDTMQEVGHELRRVTIKSYQVHATWGAERVPQQGVID